MKELLEMLSKKKGMDSEMGDTEKTAKMEVLKELFELAMEESGKGVADGMQELTVMADDKEGLMEGLDKAEDMMEQMPEAEEMMGEEKEVPGEQFIDSEDEEDEEEKRKKRM